jgi:hypothetical protein
VDDNTAKVLCSHKFTLMTSNDFGHDGRHDQTEVEWVNGWTLTRKPSVF